MANDAKLELHRLGLEYGKQYTYFVLTAAGAAIAASISHTSGAEFADQHYIWLAAVILWALSFFFGLRNLRKVRAAINLNYEMLRLADNLLEHGQSHEAEALKQAAISDIENVNTKANTSYWLQQWLLFAGGVAYIIFHVNDMMA